VVNPAQKLDGTVEGHSSTTNLSLRVLGTFDLCADGISVSISSRRGRALLAYLALQPAFTASRERLATLLWGDRQDRQARQSLRQCLLSLRQELEAYDADLLQVGIDTVALDRSRVSADVFRFPPLAQSDAPSDLSEAIDLYRGDFLDGLRVDSEPFQEWLAYERARLQSLAKLALQKAAASDDPRNGGGFAVAAAERLVALDPLNESSLRQLLTLLWRSGGSGPALSRAEEFLRLLRQALNPKRQPEP